MTGCTDATACNYDADPTTDTDNSLCTYVNGICETCEGGLIVDNDQDDDGVCDADEVEGCTDATACNYDADPTTDTNNTLCVYATGCDTCSGQTDGTGTVVDNDADDDGVCDANEVTCTDPAAATTTLTRPPTPTTYVDGICETCEGGLIVDNDADDDGVCDANEVTGCTDPTACNYDADPTTDTDNSLCTYVDGICETCENGLIVDNDADDDGVCDANEVTGCTDASACNYDADPTTDTDNSLCTYVDGICETCINGLIIDNDADDDGICDADETAGCTDPQACNTGSFTDTDNSLCVYADDICESCQEGAVIPSDADGDGICDADEIPGCTDDAACNYNPAATDENGTCLELDECGICGGNGIPAGDCDCNGNQLDALGVCGGDCSADADGDGVCDDVDFCIGEFDARGVCNGPGEIYECGCATSRPATATATATSSTPSASAVEIAPPMRMQTASVTTSTTASESSTPAASATDLARSTSVAAPTFRPATATATATSSTPSASAVATAPPMRMQTASVMTSTTASESSTPAASATDLARSTSVAAPTSQRETVTATATSSTPSASAVATAPPMRMQTASVMTSTTASESSTPAASATDLARSTSVAAPTSQRETVTATATSSTPSAFAVATAPPMRMQTASVTTSTTASESSTPVASATDLARSTSVAAPTSRPATVIAMATSSTPSASAGRLRCGHRRRWHLRFR